MAERHPGIVLVFLINDDFAKPFVYDWREHIATSVFGSFQVVVSKRDNIQMKGFVWRYVLNGVFSSRLPLSMCLVLSAIIFLSFPVLGSDLHRESEDSIAILEKVLSINSGTISLRSNHYPYLLQDSLFSDYAYKMRSIYMPEGSSYDVLVDGQISYPEGAILSKTFYYPKAVDGSCRSEDSAVSEVQFDYQRSIDLVDHLRLEEVCLVETRILRKSPNGWDAYAFAWEEATPHYNPSGGYHPMVGVGPEGRSITVEYSMPTLTECASCHMGSRRGSTRFAPIGPSYERLDSMVGMDDGRTLSQILHWESIFDKKSDRYRKNRRPRDGVAVDASLNEKAIKYLDVNCAHCHNPNGLAASSSLFLDTHEQNNVQRGICKYPVASASSSPDVKYDISPGQPDESFLYHRMISDKPGQMMPELGRRLIDTRGSMLVFNWIKSLAGNCN